MKYDFTSIIDRKGKDASAYDSVGKYKWGIEPDCPKEGFDFIPLWVADMNFPTCPAITDRILFEGPSHIRLNLASPRVRLEEAFRRMSEYVFV